MSLFSLVLPLVLPVLSSIPMASAGTPAPADLPPVDFTKMGTVSLGGSFAGLDWWSSDNPFASPSSSSSSPRFSAEGDTVLVRDKDGSYRPIGATSAGGIVKAVCWMDGKDGGNGTVFAAGAFGAVGGKDAQNVAAYSLQNGQWNSMGSGIRGTVGALYCDGENDQVWLGGNFTSPTGNGTNVALWSTSSSAFTTVPFTGLNGAVSTISSSSSGLYFGGSFSTTFSSSTSTNLTTNYTSAPSAPPNTSTTGNSGYLTPVTLPGASSAAGELTITAGPSTEDGRYNNARVLLCPGEGTWLAREGQISEVVLLGYNFWRATGARVSNGLAEGRGTKTFW